MRLCVLYLYTLLTLMQFSLILLLTQLNCNAFNLVVMFSCTLSLVIVRISCAFVCTVCVENADKLYIHI